MKHGFQRGKALNEVDSGDNGDTYSRVGILFGPIAIQRANDTPEPPVDYAANRDKAAVSCSADALRGVLIRGDTALARADYATALAVADRLAGGTDTSPGVGSLMSACRPPISSLVQAEGLYLRARAKHGLGHDDAARSASTALLNSAGTLERDVPALMSRLYPKVRILYKKLGCQVPSASTPAFYACATGNGR